MIRSLGILVGLDDPEPRYPIRVDDPELPGPPRVDDPELSQSVVTTRLRRIHPVFSQNTSFFFTLSGDPGSPSPPTTPFSVLAKHPAVVEANLFHYSRTTHPIVVIIVGFP